MNEERIRRANDRDVVLFWKTHMLYYVKPDRLFNSLEVEVDDRKFLDSEATRPT